MTSLHVGLGTWVTMKCSSLCFCSVYLISLTVLINQNFLSILLWFLMFYFLLFIFLFLSILKKDLEQMMLIKVLCFPIAKKNKTHQNVLKTIFFISQTPEITRKKILIIIINTIIFEDWRHRYSLKVLWNRLLCLEFRDSSVLDCYNYF